MPKCIVKGCRNRQGRSKNQGRFMLHKFPNSNKTIKLWLAATGQDFGDLQEMVQNIKEKHKFGTHRICSEHFDDQSYVDTGTRKYLKANSVPTIFHGNKQMSTRVSSTSTLNITTSTSVPHGGESTSVETQYTTNDILGEIINVQARKRKRFMDHDYTEESMEYAFAKFVSEGSNTDYLPRKDKSTNTGERFARRSIQVQIQPSLFRKNVKTSTRDLVFTKNCSTLTDSFGLPDFGNVTISEKLQVGSQMEISQTSLLDVDTQHEEHKTTPIKITPTSAVKVPLECLDMEIAGPQSELEKTLQEETCQDVDPTYSPSTLEDGYLGELSFLSEPTPEDYVAETKFLVFESAIDQLIRKITNCSYNGTCDAFIVERKKKITGTLLTVLGVCENDHETEIWNSQPIVKGKAVGNIMSSAAVLFSGSQFVKVEEMYNILGMPFISKSTHCDHQKEYFFPVIDKHYEADHRANIRDLKGHGVRVCGDGQCDSPGLTAKYCTYTVTDEENHRILDCNTVQVSEATSSAALETKAFKQSMAKIREEGVKVEMVVTDRHVSIRSAMAKEFKGIEHQFDVWQSCKSLFTKLRAICRKRKCKEIAQWNLSIMNHLWTSCAMSRGNVALLKERWNSILHHIIGEHSWDNGNLISSCAHDPIINGVGRPKKWLKKDSVAFGELSKLVLDKRLQNDLNHLADFCHKGNLEIFRSMVLKYMPKGLHFEVDGIVARTRLAVLAHNNNVNKSQVTVHNSDGMDKVNAEHHKTYFSKLNKLWMIKQLYKANTINHIYPMMADVIRQASGELALQWVSKANNFPNL